jgi:hypothetical protein
MPPIESAYLERDLALKGWSKYTPLPTWVPAAGEVVTYTVGGGVLTNNLRAVYDPAAVGYDLFYIDNVLQYSGRVLHNNWRSFGGYIIYGGGHSATNYNGLNMLTFGLTTIYFENIVTPTDWIADLDTGNISTNSEVNSYGEAQTSGVPHTPLRLASPHSYGIGDVVSNKLIQVASAAWGYSNVGAEQAAHELDLSDPTASSATRAWVRRTSSTGSWSWFAAPMLSREVPAQNRIYFVANGPGGPYAPLWFDLQTNQWVTGSGTGFNYPEATLESGALIHVPSRDLLICAYRNNTTGNLVLQHMNVAAGVTQPTLGSAVTLSENLAVPNEFGSICWCSDNNRLLVFGVVSNTNKVYEIEIPVTLSSTWNVDNYTLAGGATIVPNTSANIGNYGKSWDYCSKSKCIPIFTSTSLTQASNDSIRIYRPRNT